MEAQKNVLILFAVAVFSLDLVTQYSLFTYIITLDYATGPKDVWVSEVGLGRVCTIQDDVAVIAGFWKAVEFQELRMRSAMIS